MPSRLALGLLALALALAACGGGGPDLLLLPADPDGGLTATTIDAVPGDDGRCGAEHQDDWEEPPTDSPVVAIPGVGYTYARTAPATYEDGTSGPLTVICDLDPDGVLVVADELRTTGTDQPVGNDYISRAGAQLGRVDVGIPDGAATALQILDGWTLLIPLDPAMEVIRFHAVEGGTPEEGYDVGEVRFLTAEGRDVTTASVPVPDIIHGVPRDRGSGVDDP